MLRPLICGSSSIHNSDEGMKSGTKTKKTCKCRTKLCSKGVKASKNPYATRGLDKFSSLVAELMEKRNRIYAQTKDPDDIYVWFNFSGSDDCKPIILKMKDKQNKTEKKSNKSEDIEKATAKTAEPSAAEPHVVYKTKMKYSKSWLVSRYSCYPDELRQRPLLCLLAAVILILMFLIMFGRSGTVIWITVGWYVLPSATNTRSSTKVRWNSRTKDTPAKTQVVDVTGKSR